MAQMNKSGLEIRRHLRNAAVDATIGVAAAEAWLLFAVMMAMRIDSAAGMGIFAVPLVILPGAAAGILIGFVVRAVVRHFRGRRKRRA